MVCFEQYHAHTPIYSFHFAPTNYFMPAQHYGVVVAQSVELATPGKEVLGSIPAVAARSLLVGSVYCQYNVTD